MKILNKLFLFIFCFFAFYNIGFGTDQIYLATAADFWKEESPSGHGVLLFSFHRNLSQDQQLNFTYNTDTIMVNYYTGLSPFLSSWSQVKGEYVLAGLLPDYYQNAKKIKEGGFNASFIELETHLILAFSENQKLHLSLVGKNWFFEKNKNTGADFRLPKDFMQFSPALKYEYQDLKLDLSLYEPHRFFPRIMGLLLRFSLQLDYRNHTQAWGFLGSTIHRSNHPQKFAFIANQSLAFGYQFKDILRFQLRQNLFLSEFTDDINAIRAGGLNNYVIPVAGMPWAALLARNLLSFHPAFYYKILEDSEVGIEGDVVYLEDMNRNGSADWSTLYGLAFHFDLRINQWQFNLKSGISFADKQFAKDTYYSIYIALGRKFDF